MVDRLDIGLRLPSFRPPRKLSLGKAPEEYNAEDMQRIIDGLEQWSENVQAQRTQEAFNLISEAFRRLDKRDASFAQQLAKGLDDLIRRPKVKVEPGDGPFLDLLYRSVVPWHLQDKTRDGLRGLHEGLQLSYTATDQITTVADKLSIEGVTIRDINEVADLDDDIESGGSKAADTWYSIWIEASPRGEQRKAIIGTSSSRPVLDNGYSIVRRVGWGKTKPGSAEWLQFLNAKDSDWFLWNEDETAVPLLVLNVATSVTSAADVDCSGAAAPTADELRIEAEISSVATSDKHLHLRKNGLSNLTDPDFIALVGKSIAQTGNIECDESQIIEYWTNSTTYAVDIAVLGYRIKR